MAARMRAGGAAGVLEAVAARGGSTARVLQSAGLTPADLADPDCFLDLERIVRLQDAAARETGDPAFGLHLGAAFDLGALGALSYAVLNAPRVRAALRNLERYGRAHMQEAPVTLAVAEGLATLSYQPGGIDPELARHHVESTAVIGARILRRLAGGDWRPREMRFRHSRPAATAEHALLFGAPVRFGQAENAVVFAAGVLDAAVHGADPWLLPIVEDHLRQQIDRTARSEFGRSSFGAIAARSRGRPAEAGWPQAVRDLVTRSVSDGQATVRAVSRRLGLSVRTFQRQLAAHGLVFKQLVDDVRHELALRHLGDPTATLTDIALLLGYSELSAFDRAFRRWTGVSPLEHRRRVRAAGPA
jgi:AraC-like DNA-binding protein